MVTKAQRNTNTVKNTQANAATQSAADETTNVATLNIKTGGTRKGGVFSSVATELSDKIADKMALIGAVRQTLAEAKDLFAEGAEKATEATDTANKAAVKLYQARATNVVTPDEVSAILGDQFGFKITPKGEVSKTPDGQGEVIRKRIVRMVQARDYVSNDNPGTFFTNVDKDAVEEVVTGVDDGEYSIFYAYDLLAKIKSEGRGPSVKPAFNPRTITGILKDLSEPGAMDKLAKDNLLRAAYAELYTVLQTIEQNAPVPEAEQAAA